MLAEAGQVRALLEDEVRALGEQGAFVRDGFLGEARALAALEQARTLRAQGQLRAAGIRKAGTLDTSVRNDELAWLEPSVGGALAGAVAAFEELREALVRDAWLCLGRFHLQLPHYPGQGARYVRHRDAFAGGENRRVTAILYLNAGWEPAHGGQLRLFLEPLR